MAAFHSLDSFTMTLEISSFNHLIMSINMGQMFVVTLLAKLSSGEGVIEGVRRHSGEEGQRLGKRS